eukprot:TRINITY_DN62035_c0_g1_i1.p1 TRINITY_DN62035_c0_g1~~TRINITY_DN62035_c0_g1_i1.p1  ORF type:complete len:1106 (+),score=127.62 TRINITY_DN62035_c0_g1_i1:66-3383(+)
MPEHASSWADRAARLEAIRCGLASLRTERPWESRAAGRPDANIADPVGKVCVAKDGWARSRLRDDNQADNAEDAPARAACFEKPRCGGSDSGDSCAQRNARPDVLRQKAGSRLGMHARKQDEPASEAHGPPVVAASLYDSDDAAVHTLRPFHKPEEYASSGASAVDGVSVQKSCRQADSKAPEGSSESTCETLAPHVYLKPHPSPPPAPRELDLSAIRLDTVHGVADSSASPQHPPPPPAPHEPDPCSSAMRPDSRLCTHQRVRDAAAQPQRPPKPTVPQQASSPFQSVTPRRVLRGRPLRSSSPARSPATPGGQRLKSASPGHPLSGFHPCPAPPASATSAQSSTELTEQLGADLHLSGKALGQSPSWSKLRPPSQATAEQRLPTKPSYHPEAQAVDDMVASVQEPRVITSSSSTPGPKSTSFAREPHSSMNLKAGDKKVVAAASTSAAKDARGHKYSQHEQTHASRPLPEGSGDRSTAVAGCTSESIDHSRSAATGNLLDELRKLRGEAHCVRSRAAADDTAGTNRRPGELWKTMELKLFLRRERLQDLLSILQKSIPACSLDSLLALPDHELVRLLGEPPPQGDTSLLPSLLQSLAEERVRRGVSQHAAATEEFEQSTEAMKDAENALELGQLDMCPQHDTEVRTKMSEAGGSIAPSELKSSESQRGEMSTSSAMCPPESQPSSSQPARSLAEASMTEVPQESRVMTEASWNESQVDCLGMSISEAVHPFASKTLSCEQAHMAEINALAATAESSPTGISWDDSQWLLRETGASQAVRQPASPGPSNQPDRRLSSSFQPPHRDQPCTPKQVEAMPRQLLRSASNSSTSSVALNCSVRSMANSFQPLQRQSQPCTPKQGQATLRASPRPRPQQMAPPSSNYEPPERIHPCTPKVGQATPQPPPRLAAQQTGSAGISGNSSGSSRPRARQARIRELLCRMDSLQTPCQADLSRVEARQKQAAEKHIRQRSPMPGASLNDRPSTSGLSPSLSGRRSRSLMDLVSTGSGPQYSARRACPIEPSALDDVMARLPAQAVSASGGLNSGSASTGPEPCSICLEVPTAGEVVTTLLCCHWYHTECIREWLLHSRFCPLCKALAVPEELGT